MAVRHVAVAILALVTCGCMPPVTAPTSASPSVIATPGAASATVAATSPLPTTSASTREFRVALDADSYPALADEEALVVASTLGGPAPRLSVVDLRTNSTTLVRARADGPMVTGLRDGVIAFTETTDGTEVMTQRVRVFAGRWRDPATITQLDDLVIQIGGGDAWNPWPGPQTNGWEVAWMHAGGATGIYELRMREADGRIGTIYSSKMPFSFSLARNGDVAIADIALANQTAPVSLRIYSAGATRVVVQRPVSASGYVRWTSGRVVWSNGLGLVRPMESVELIDPATLTRETIGNPPGCFGYTGSTEAQIAFLCGDHVEFLRGPGPSRVGPPIPLVHQRAIIRTEQGPPRVAFITPVVTNDPRPGAGAHF